MKLGQVAPDSELYRWNRHGGVILLVKLEALFYYLVLSEHWYSAVHVSPKAAERITSQGKILFVLNLRSELYGNVVR